MKNHIIELTVILLCSVLLGSGCTTPHRQFAEASRPSEGVAMITIHHGPIYTDKLNGAPPKIDKSRLAKNTLLWGGILHFAMNVNPKIVEVIPGKQNLEVNFCIVTGSSQSGNTRTTTYLHSIYPKTLSFDAQPGRVYRVNGKQEGNNWSAWVEDFTGGKVSVVSSTGQGSDRAEFEEALQKAMSSGAISSDEITVTYPDGSQKKIPNPSK